MPYHSDSCNHAARRLLLWGLVGLVALGVALELYRQWLGGWSAGGTRQ